MTITPPTCPGSNTPVGMDMIGPDMQATCPECGQRFAQGEYGFGYVGSDNVAFRTHPIRQPQKNAVSFNDMVWVQLTEEGRQQLHQHYVDMHQYGVEAEARRLKMAAEHGDWFMFQLHELMHIFGSVSVFGLPEPFVGSMIHFTKPKGA